MDAMKMAKLDFTFGQVMLLIALAVTASHLKEIWQIVLLALAGLLLMSGYRAIARRRLSARSRH